MMTLFFAPDACKIFWAATLGGFGDWQDLPVRHRRIRHASIAPTKDKAEPWLAGLLQLLYPPVLALDLAIQ